MRKILPLIALMLFCVSCNQYNGNGDRIVDDSGKCKSKKNEKRFVVVEKTFDYNIVYDRHTLVMYAVSKSSDNAGDFCLLYNADGKPLLYKEEEM